MLPLFVYASDDSNGGDWDKQWSMFISVNTVIKYCIDF